MNSATSHYLIPAEPGRGRALALAALVHFLLLVFLWFGVSWQSDTPTEVEAEIWNPVTREAAPTLPPPPPVAKPIQEPPMPVAAVTPPSPPAPVVQPQPAQQKLAEPDIALEKEKKRKQEKENTERLKKEKLAEKKALEEEQKRKKITAAEEKQNEKKKQAELDKTKRADDKKQKEEAAIEEKKKLAEERQRKEEEAATEQRARKRREDIQRLNQMAGDGGAGDAEKSQGPRGDNSYARKVAGLIKSHTILPQNDIAGNPAVEFLIELLPDGGLRGEPKMTKQSGIAAFDQAVKRAIEKSAPFPLDPSTGKVPANINITHRLKDSDTR